MARFARTPATLCGAGIRARESTRTQKGRFTGADAAARASQASRSAPALTQPWRAHVTGSAPGGFRNQVVGRKLCSRRSRSSRSQARGLRPADPADEDNLLEIFSEFD